jgi:hypothetical protein
MRADQVLVEHHTVLRGLCKQITAAPPSSPEGQRLLDQLLVELDIHMRIEDDLFYPAVAQASTLVAVAHAEHRQVFDQLTVVLRTPPSSPVYEDEWHSFVTTLDAHADEEERDLIPPPVDVSDDALEALGAQMLARIERLRGSLIEKIHVKARTALLRRL